MEPYSALKRKEILPSAITRMILEDMTLGRVSRSHFSAKTEMVTLAGAESRTGVARGWGRRRGRCMSWARKLKPRGQIPFRDVPDATVPVVNGTLHTSLGGLSSR